MKNLKWTLEDDVDDYVKSEFDRLGKVKNRDYTVDSGMSDYMKAALAGSAKTKRKTGFGKPDFQIENLGIPVVIEDKLYTKKLIAQNAARMQEINNKLPAGFLTVYKCEYGDHWHLASTKNPI
jgi:hypothetical protein